MANRSPEPMVACWAEHMRIGLRVSRLARFYRAGGRRGVGAASTQIRAACRLIMEAVTPSSPDKKNKSVAFNARKKRIELTPKQIEVLDWIENFVVPALVEQYIKEKILSKEHDRG